MDALPPKVQLGTVEIEDDGRTMLTLRTVEHIDVRFELDDQALGCLYLTVPSAMEERLRAGNTRAFWRQGN